MVQADSERPGAIIAKGDIAQAGEFEFGVRPAPSLGKAALCLGKCELRGLEVAVVGEGGLDKRFDAERRRIECR